MNASQITFEPPEMQGNRYVEPCFLDRCHWIKSPMVAHAEKVSEYLTHMVTRLPHDLTSHTQRICLFIKLNNPDETYGALIDLFIVLDDKGRALRERLLSEAESLLTKEQYNLQGSALYNPVAVAECLPFSKYTALSSGAEGKTTLVRQLDENNDGKEDPLLVACDLINSGHIEQAQQMLEQAVVDAPLREDLCHELLHIYQHTRNRSACIAMLQRMNGQAFAIPQAWAELILSLDQQDDEECSYA